MNSACCGTVVLTYRTAGGDVGVGEIELTVNLRQIAAIHLAVNRATVGEAALADVELDGITARQLSNLIVRRWQGWNRGFFLELQPLSDVGAPEESVLGIDLRVARIVGGAFLR